ncbi:MAG TPA: hypothetical protein VG815_04340 [Chloroflexota bacterium]|nr:hypothetical protein [Chloroflexota bacterium]
MRSEDNQHEHRSALNRFFTRISGKQEVPLDQRYQRLQERRTALQKATDEWLSLLQEMEEHGESEQAAYERYHKAYLDAKHQQKEVELELFNLRNMRAS